MKVLYTTGKRDLNFVEWCKPEIKKDQIEVKTVYSGICRSDIAAYAGWEKAMPLGMQGHEGLGVVSKVGKNITEVKEGDYVATISDPTYSEYYNASQHQFVKVPKLEPKYIIQPTACAINIIFKSLHFYSEKNKILLIGSGFMSIIIGQYLKNLLGITIDILGESHKKIWEELGHNLINKSQLEEYNKVIDLSSKADNFYLFKDIVKLEGLICYASTPFSNVSTNFFDNCWKCHTIIMPSPRNSNFKNIMELTVPMIDNGTIDPSRLWTKEYNFYTDYKQAFEDGVNRTSNYIRGYFKF